MYLHLREKTQEKQPQTSPLLANMRDALDTGAGIPTLPSSLAAHATGIQRTPSLIWALDSKEFPHLAIPCQPAMS
uniref:Uncharacterized protein n=1 Tax=Timema tahoe TaxID=61484 RepID=A0A7R9NWM2_9NEOP|nr:unnamed protein product [Timema tahoe]